MLLRGVAGCNVRSIFTLIVIFLAQPALGSQASVPVCFFCANDRCLLAFSFWRPSQRLLRICCIATASAHLLHRSVFCASVASQRLLCICCIAASSAERQALPFRLPLRFIPPLRLWPAISSRWLSVAAPRLATNLIWRRRSPVWLAIWRTWAGFANSQLRRAAFRCTYSYIWTHPRYCRLEPLLRQTQIFRPICTDCLRHLRISAE